MNQSTTYRKLPTNKTHTECFAEVAEVVVAEVDSLPSIVAVQLWRAAFFGFRQ